MYRVLLAMLACQAAVALAAFALPVVAPAAAASLGVPPTLIGYYTTLMLLGAMLTTGLITGFVRRYGALRVSQMILVIAALAMLSLPIAAQSTGMPFVIVLLLVVSAILAGLAYGPANPASSHLLARFTPDHLRARIFSIKQTSVPVGGAIAGSALPILERALGWQAAIMAVACVCLGLAAALQPLRGAMDADRQPYGPLVAGGVLKAPKLVFQNPALRHLAMASGAFGAMQFCFVSLFVTYAVTQTGADLLAVGSALSTGLVVSIGARVIWGWLADRFTGRGVLSALGLLMAASAFATAALGPGWPYAAVVALAVVFGSTGTAWQGVYLAEVARLAPAEGVAEATAGSLTLTFLGALIGPGLFSLLASLTGYDAAGFVVIGAITFVFGLSLMRAGRSP